MASTINNSYTRAALSGFAASTIAELSNRTMPISLTTAVSLAVNKTFNFISKSFETHRKTLDETIAQLTAPALFIAGADFIIRDKNHSDPRIDIPALALGLIATNTKVIQPIIRFIAPAQTTYKAISLTQQIPLLKHYPSLLRASTSYLISSLAAQALENSFDVTETLPLCEKLAITTFLGFAAIDLYPTFTSVLTELKQYISPMPSSIDIVNSKPIEVNEEENLFDESNLLDEVDLPDNTFTPLLDKPVRPTSPNSVADLDSQWDEIATYDNSTES